MTTVKEKAHTTITNDNLKNLKPFAQKGSPRTNSSKTDKETKDLAEKKETDVSQQAKNLNESELGKSEQKMDESEAGKKASSVAEKIAKTPILPILSAKPDSKLQKKLEDKIAEKTNYINKPAVIFIEGFSAFGISNGDGIKDMADNYPGAKLFAWDQKEDIIAEIKKHKLDQPVVLVGHSFGGDTAVEIANELNSAKNSFRNIDLLVTLDSVGFKNNIIPLNVQRNLNFFQEGIVPFLHGSPNIARKTDHTEVINELRSELHSKIEDSEEVQYKIFENINNTIQSKNEIEPEIIIQLNLDDLIDSSLSLEKKQ